MAIQVASVFGALGLLSLTYGFIDFFIYSDIEWRGFAKPLVDLWVEAARPAVSLLFLPLQELAMSVFGSWFEPPGLLLDYLGVGFTFVLSRWRGAVGGWREGLGKARVSAWRNRSRVFVMALRTFLIWPVEVWSMLRNLLWAQTLYGDKGDGYVAQIRLSHFLSLSPAFIAIGLVILNWIYVLLTLSRVAQMAAGRLRLV